MDSQLKEIFKDISAEKHYAPCTYSEIPSGKTELNITSGQNANWTYAIFFVQNDNDSVNSFRINEGQYVIKKGASDWVLLDYKNDIKASGIDEIRAFVNSIASIYQSFLRSLNSNNASKDKDYHERYKTATLQHIFYGAPGTGKSHIINELTEGESVIRTTFHPDSDYSTFVGAYKPTMGLLPICDELGQPMKIGSTVLHKEQIIYEFVEQAFLQAYVQAWKYYAKADEGTEPKKQYLIIEEINRGNCAQIFGDLFQLLDRNCCGFSDYPIHADNDMKAQLAKAFKGLSIAQADKINACYKGKDIASQVLAGEILLLPNNLYIWATMNTSDQSLFPIDSAFKRRWDWQYMPICKGHDENGNELNWKISADTKEYDWWSFLTEINKHIHATTNSEDKKLGFFFCKPQGVTISSETFVGKVIFYLWNDVFKDFDHDGPIFKDTDGSELSFNKFYKTDNKGNAVVQKDKVEVFLNNLGVSVFADIDSDEEPLLDEDGNEVGTNSSNKDKSRYSLNGTGNYKKGPLALATLELFIKQHSNLTADEIYSEWKTLSLDRPSHFIENEDEYNSRISISTDKSGRTRCNPANCGDGHVLYISTEWTLDSISLFIERVNAKNWGIHIEKINE